MGLAFAMVPVRRRPFRRPVSEPGYRPPIKPEVVTGRAPADGFE